MSHKADIMAAHRKPYLDEAARMYEKGLSVGEIAALYQVSRQSMWASLKRRVTLRPQLRFGKDNHFFRGGGNIIKRAAHIVEHAVTKGILVRQACESCHDDGKFKDGRSKIHGHHDDYNKPLEVRWLCQKCHHEWHKTNRPRSLNV